MGRRAAKAIAGVVACLIAVTAGSGAASAAKPRPKPTPSPLPAPAAPVVGRVTVSESNSAQVTFANPFELGVDWSATITGPALPDSSVFGFGGPRASVEVTGLARATQLVPDSTYVLTVRRYRFYDASTNQAVNILSAPTQVTFRTLTLAQSRPSAPVISRSGGTSASAFVNWAPSTDNTSFESQIYYTYAVVGDPYRAAVPTCSAYCFGATGAAVPLPAPGTSIRVTVTAYDNAGVASLPSNELVIAG